MMDQERDELAAVLGEIDTLACIIQKETTEPGLRRVAAQISEMIVQVLWWLHGEELRGNGTPALDRGDPHGDGTPGGGDPSR